MYVKSVHSMESVVFKLSDAFQVTNSPSAVLFPLIKKFPEILRDDAREVKT